MKVMHYELIRIFSEELRESKKLVVETGRMADAAENQTNAAMKKADTAMKKADVAWELVNHPVIRSRRKLPI